MAISNNQYMFFLLCIPTRVFLAYLTTIVSAQFLPIFGTIFGLIAASWIYLFIFVGQSCKFATGEEQQTCAETSPFGQEVWWNNQRPIHAILYICAAVLCFKGNKYAWVPIIADAIFGLANGIRKAIL
jgi:hypothetical protein